jgi:hypothetical protein
MNFRLPANFLLTATLLLAIVGISTHAAVPAKAQGGLSEEQLALLERVVAAVQKVDEYSSYVNTETSTLSLDGNISIATFSQNILRVQSLEKTTTYVLGDNPNALVLATYSIEESEEAGDTTGYTVEAEARYVDGTLYLAAEVVDGDAEEASVPEGWASGDDLEGYGIFDDINLDGLLERVGAVEPDDEANSPLEDLEVLEKVATDVTAEEITLEDGTAATAITISMDFVTLLTEAPESFGGDEPDESSLALFSAFEGSVVQAVVVLGEDDNPISYELSFEGSLVDFDAAVISPQAAGGTLNLNFSFGQSSELSQVNEAIEPVAAPEE